MRTPRPRRVPLNGRGGPLIAAVSMIVMASAAGITAVNLALPSRLVPASSPAVGGLCALVLMLGFRYLHRLREKTALRPDPRTATPVLLFGAGREDIPEGVRRTGAETVVCSVSNADAGLIDLLGRRQLEIGPAPVAGFLRGKRVLVTGAGGSIGSELCRQIQRFEPAELIMLDRDESALHAVQLSLHGRGLLDSPDLVLADLRDTDRLRSVFTGRAPDVVFHAAALKHLPLLERYPGEAVKTNIRGTQSMLELAKDVGTFVNISTDKATDPTSVLGYSKRITERLTAYAAAHRPGSFLSVRFGNVLGSRGSVLTAFRAQVAGGGPITVTHPEVTRYFMTVHEAVQLVIQAAVIGGGGQSLVLDMGRPVRISEVARQLAAQSPQPVDIVYTGLRPGEKLHETLFGEGELDQRPLHPLVSHVDVPPIDPAQVQLLDPYARPELLVSQLAALCREPAPSQLLPAADK